MEHEVSDRNEWFKDVKRLIRGLEVETVEDPFACPTVKSVTDGEDVLHALGLHPSRDVCGIVNVDIDEVYGLIRHIEPEPVTGSTSDGYHTFDELYHHRAVLFSVIVAMFRGRSWKSLHHHDGTMYDGMFIVGIDTPAGPATYHYDVEPYWDMFPCEVLDRAPEWDGHTPDDAIERIGTLRDILQAETEEEGSEKALLVGLFDRTFTCLDHRISASDEDAGPTRRPVAVVMRRDGRLQEVDPWRVVIDDSEEVFEMYSWMWDEEIVVCEQLGDADGLVLEVANDVGCVQRDRREL